MFADRIARGVPIDKFGDGSSCRDYTYVDDIVSGILAALDNPRPCEVYNLGNNRVVSLNEFISVIEKTVGRKAIINQKPDQPGDVPITYADLTKSQEMLGYNPRHTIEEGMAKFVQWYFTREDPRNGVALASPPLAPAVVYDSEEGEGDISDFSEDDEDGGSISSGISEDATADEDAEEEDSSSRKADARSTISTASYSTLIARTPPPGGARFEAGNKTLVDGRVDLPDDATECEACTTDNEDALEFSKLHVCGEGQRQGVAVGGQQR